MSGMPCLAAATKSSSEYAYMQIFDANDPKERRKLLSYIIKDPHASFMFLLHCNPDATEYAVAFEQIVNNPEYCNDLLKKKGTEIPSSMRNRALMTILEYPNLVWNTAWTISFTTEEKKIIFDKHREQFLQNKTLDNYWKQWQCFGDVFPSEEIAVLVDMVYNTDEYKTYDYKTDNFEIYHIVDTLISYGKLTDDQKEMLEGKLLSYKLRGWR